MLYLYFIQSGEDGPIKIGVATNPVRRLEILQIGNPAELFLRGTCPGTYELEGEVHARWAPFRVRGEWFSADAPGLVAAVAQARLRPDEKLLTRAEEADRRERIEAKATHLARNGYWAEAQALIATVPPETDRSDW